MIGFRDLKYILQNSKSNLGMNELRCDNDP